MKPKYKPTDYGKVAVLMGGQNSEREVSLMSGRAVLQALQEAGIDAFGIDVDKTLVGKLLESKPSRVFNALHGSYGEDGTVQGLLESLNIPYTGSSVLASAIAMDKVKTKILWKAIGLPVPEHILANRQTNFADVIAKTPLPWAVKPISEGSSAGVTKVHSEQEFALALEKAVQYQPEVLIEPWLEGKELTVGIIGSTPLPVIHIETPIGFYDYEAKYFSDQTLYNIPSGLSVQKEQELQKLAMQAYHTLGCRHWGRVDLIMDPQQNFWFLELNTIPGLTSHSLVPQAAAALGINFQTMTLLILEQTMTDNEC